MNNSNSYVLFYSEKCPHSREFIQLINNSRFGNTFRKYCIERMAKVPNGIFEVPTIIVPGYNVPLSGDNVFKWFNQVNSGSGSREDFSSKKIAPPQPPRRPAPETRVTPQQKRNEPTSVGGHSSPETDTSGEPSPFGLELSAGFSDIYSYIDDDAGKPLVHAFEYIDNNGGVSFSKGGTGTTASSVGTESSRPGSNARDEKANKFNKKYEEFMMSRNSDPVCNASNVRQI